jgi:WD40 repeat protein
MYRQSFSRLLPCLALALLTALPLVGANEEKPVPGLVATLKGHTEAIYDIAYSRDGKYLVTAGGDHTVRVWEAATGKELKTFGGQNGHQKIVVGVSVSPDDSLIASAGSDDNTLRVWDFPSSTPQRELAVKDGALALAVTADGGTIAAACKDGHVRLWNSADGKPRGDAAGHAGAIIALAAAPNGQALVSAGKDRTLRYWRPTDGGPLGSLVAHSAELTGLAIGPNSNPCYTTAADGTLKFWSLPPVGSRPLPAHEKAVTALALSKDGNLVVSGGADKSVRLSNVANGQESVALADNGALVAAGTADRLLVWQAGDGRLLAQPLAKGGVGAAAFSPSLTQLATGGKDGLLRLWQMPPLPAQSFTHPEAVRAAVVSVDGKRLCTGGADGLLRTWNMANPQQPERSFTGHTGAINAVAINPKGDLLASAGEDATIRFWNPANGQQAMQIGAHGGPVTSLAFAADGQVLSAGADGLLKLWQVPAAPGKLFAHPGQVTSAVLSPDGSRLITGCADKQVRVWDLAKGQAELTLGGHTLGELAVAVNAKGTQLASGGADRTVRVRDLPGGKEVKQFTLPAAVHSVAFSPDGKRLAAGLADNSIHLLEPASGKDVGTLSGHKGAVRAVLFSLQGDQLLSGSLDKTVKVWAPADGKVKTTLEQPAAVHTLALNKDGTSLAAGGAEGVVKLWSLGEGKVEATLETPGTVHGLAFSPDGQRLLVGGEDGGARVYGRDGKLVERFRHDKPVLAVAYHPDGKRLFSASADQTVRPWGLSLVWQAAHDGAVRQAVLAAGVERIVSGGADGAVKVWNSADGKLLHTLKLEGPVQSVGVSGDAQIVAACGGKTVRVWALPAKAQDKEAKPQEIALPAAAESLTLSGNGSRLAVALAEPKGQVRVFDLPGGRELLTLTEHQDRVRGLAFLPDNRTLVSAGDDKTARLADVNVQTVLEAHKGGVTGMAYHTNGAQLLSAGADRAVKLWDLAKGTVVRTFGPLDKPVSAVAFNRACTQVATAAGKEVKVWGAADGKEVRTLAQPAEAAGLSFSADGSRLAVATADSQVHVWELASGLELQGFLHGGAVRAVAFHPGNNAVLVSGSDDKTIAVHTLTIARVVATGAAVRALAVIPDGNHVLTADPEGKVKHWTAAGVNDRTQEVGTKGIRALAVAKNNQLLAVAGEEASVRVFNLADGKLLGTIPTPGPVRSLSFAPSSQALAAVCAGQGKAGAPLVRTWKVPFNPGQPLPEEFGQPAQTYSEVGDASDAAFAPNGNVLYSSSGDGPVRAWKFAADTPVKNFGHPNIVDSAAFSPDGKQLASGCHDGHVRIFDVAKAQQLRDIVAHAAPPMPSAIYCVAWSPDGKQVLSASLDRTLKLWNAADGKLIREFKAYHEKTFPKGHQDAVFTAVFSPDGKTIASAGYDGSIKLWNAADGSVARELTNPHVKAATAGTAAAHPGPIFRLRFSHDGKRLLSVGKAPQRQGYLGVWNAADGKLLHGEQLTVGNLLSLAIAPDGQTLAVGTGGEDTGTGYVLRMPQGK